MDVRSRREKKDSRLIYQHAAYYRAKGFFYGLGTLARSSVGFVASSWLLYFYLPPTGDPLIPIGLYGLAIFGGRLVSAVITPYIGYLSDSSENRFGRRLPFMFVAAIIFLAAFALLWRPPLESKSVINWVYLLLVVIVFRLSTSLHQVPSQALLPELAEDDNEYVKLSTWDATFLLIGMMWGGMAGIFIERNGFQVMSFIYIISALVIFYAPFLVLREKHIASNTSRISFRESLMLTLRNRNFIHFVVIWVLYLVAANFVQSSVPYIVTEVCLLNTAGTTYYFYIPGVIASLLAYPLVGKLAKKWSKRKVFSTSLLASACIFPGTLFIGPWLPIPLSIQCSGWAILQSVAMAGVVVLTNAFAAEIAEGDKTHREGMYFASMKVLDQIFLGLAAILLPLVLSLGRSHLSPQGAIGVRLTGLIGGLLMLVGYLIFLGYPRFDTYTS
jgi:Na+/melibiose symporter-like transporter